MVKRTCPQSLRVKKLADETVGALMPLYKTISEQVPSACGDCQRH